MPTRYRGEALLFETIRRLICESDAIAVYAVVVDAKNERSLTFYRRYGFTPLSSPQHRLFLPLETFERLELEPALRRDGIANMPFAGWQGICPPEVHSGLRLGPRHSRTEPSSNAV